MSGMFKMNTSSATRSLKDQTTPKLIAQRSKSAESINYAYSTRLSPGVQNVEQSIITPKSFLSDATNIVEPKRKSWWKRLDENTVQNLSFLHENPIKEMDDILCDYEQVNPNGQENKNYDLDLPESSSNETIQSIVIPQRRLFNQKEITSPNKFDNIVDKENSRFNQLEPQLEKMQLDAPTEKPKKNMPVFPIALLNMSSNVTNKTQEFQNLEHNKQPKNLFSNRPVNRKSTFTNFKLIDSEDESLHLESRVRTKNLFGNCVTTMKKNRFSGLVATESEDDVPSIHPKVFEFQQPGKRRRSSVILGDALSTSLCSTSDTDFNNWKMLPSSTMVEDNVSEKSTPAKKLRLTRASYVNKECSKVNNTKSFPPISKISYKTNEVSNVNDDIQDVNNQIMKHEHKTTQLIDKSKSNMTLSDNGAVQLDGINLLNPTAQLYVNNNSNEIEKHDTETNHKKNSSSENDISIIIPDRSESKIKQVENSNNSNNQIVKVKDSNILPLNSKENSGNVKTGDRTSRDENSQSKIHTLSNSDIVNTKISLVIEKKSQNCSMGVEKLSSDEKVVENQNNKDTEILETNSSIVKVNDMLQKSKKESVTNNLEVACSEKKLHTEQKEIEDKINFNESKSLSQHDGRKLSNEQLYTQNETLNEVRSILQDEISEKEQSSLGSESDKGSQTHVENEENSSMECNMDSPGHSNSNEDNNKSIENNEHSNNENYINKNLNCNSKSNSIESQTQAKSNNNIIVEQTPENISDTSKHDSNEVNEQENIRSPEAVLNVDAPNYSYKTLPNRSSLRNTNFIQRATLRPSFFSMKDSLENDGSKHSSGEGSGWDSHRTTRRTLRQTFGKDFTFRKSLRTLVMEKSAKEHVNVENALKPNFQNTIDQFNDKSLGNFIEHEDLLDISLSKKVPEPIEFIEQNVSPKKDKCLDKIGPLQKTYSNDMQLNTIKSPIKNVITQDNGNEDLHKKTSQEDNLDKSDQVVCNNAENSNKVINENETTNKEQVTSNSASAKENGPDHQKEKTEIQGSAVQNTTNNENDVAKSNDSIDENVSTKRIDVPSETESPDEEESTKEKDSVNENESVEESESAGENEAECESECSIENESINEDKTTDAKSIIEHTSDDEENECSDEIREDNELTTDEETGIEHDHSRENEFLEDNEILEENEHVCTNKLADDMEHTEENETANERLFREENQYKSNAIKKKQTQTLLIQYMEKIKANQMERNNLIEEKVLIELKAPVRDLRSIDLYRPKPPKKLNNLNEPFKKVTRLRATPFGIPPKELLEDLNYKPKKPFKPRNAPWINKKFYKFLESKLEPKYDYRSRYRSEKFATYLYKFTQEFKKDKIYPNEAIKQLKQEMARLNIVETHFDFYVFCREFLPKEIRIKIIPDIINKLPLPRRGVHSEILINQQ